MTRPFQILAVDCATLPASLALVSSDARQTEWVQDEDLRTDAWIGVTLEQSLTEAGGIDNVDGFAVAIGPGTFTGIRVGIATCLGAAGPFGLPVAGVRTLDAIAAIGRARSDVVAACIDARRGQLYAAIYGPGHAHGPLPIESLWGPAVVDPAELARRLDEHLEAPLVLGSGAPLLGAHGEFSIVAGPLPLAAAIGRLALSSAVEGESMTANWPAAEPVYLRPPDATPPRNPLLDRQN